MRDRQFFPLNDDLVYPGNGLPPRRGEDRPGGSPFGRLVMGGVPGKSSILIYDGESSGTQPAAVNMITLNGDDADASQLAVTLHPPRVIPLSREEVAARLAQQNLTGEQTNSEVTCAHFPGTGRSMQWPPLEALVEFGTGGVGTTIVVDYVNGVTFSVVASYLRVNALVSQSRDSGDICGTSAAYYLAAHVGPGYAQPHVQRTIYVGKVDDDKESDLFNVPQFSEGAVLVGCRTGHHDDHKKPSETVGWIRFFQSPDGCNRVGDCFVRAGRGSQKVFIPNGAQYFSVYNASGHAMKMSVIFELAL